MESTLALMITGESQEYLQQQMLDISNCISQIQAQMEFQREAREARLKSIKKQKEECEQQIVELARNYETLLMEFAGVLKRFDDPFVLSESGSK
jgi:hypothetical protein